MILTPIYSCRNCHKTYPGAKQEVPNAPLEKLVPAARYTLGSQDHVFRIGGKTFQMSDLHQCNDHEVGLANFLRLEIDQGSKPNNHPPFVRKGVSFPIMSTEEYVKTQKKSSR